MNDCFGTKIIVFSKAKLSNRIVQFSYDEQVKRFVIEEENKNWKHIKSTPNFHWFEYTVNPLKEHFTIAIYKSDGTLSQVLHNYNDKPLIDNLSEFLCSVEKVTF